MNASTEGTVDTRRLIFPALGGFYESIAPYSYAIIRFCAGAIVIYHGYMKLFAGFAGPVAQNVLTPLGFPRPLAWAYFLGILEFFGGAALAVGFPARRLGVPLAVDDPLCSDLLPRRRTLRRRSHDRQRVLERNPSKTVPTPLRRAIGLLLSLRVRENKVLADPPRVIARDKAAPRQGSAATLRPATPCQQP